jgi:predicted CopG family antitoxin
MKAIILSFSLKNQNQSFSDIKERILEIKKYIGNDVMLIHGFMPRTEVEKRGFSQEINDFFDEQFPVKTNFYNNGVLRQEMAETAKQLNAEIYVIGEVIGGVEEELELYREKNLKIIGISLNGERLKLGKITDRIKTYEDACIELAITPIDEKEMLEKGFTSDEIIYRKIKTITEALNEDWEADWTNTDQKKWMPWYNVDGASASGFVFGGSRFGYSGADAGSASRLCFKSEELADYAGKQFIDLYVNFIK